MSIEDRIGSGEENVVGLSESASALEDFISLNDTSDRVGEVQIAQAETQSAQRTDRVPEGQAFPTELAANENNVVVLPENATVDEIRVEGDDLILVQADGREIVILGGADNIPTFLIGDVEVPQQVVVAVLEQSGINVAAGPEGNLAVVTAGADGSGGDFDDGLPNVDNAPPSLLDLLGNTELAFGADGNNEEDFDDTPTIIASGPFFLEEDADGNLFETGVIKGFFGFNGGADGGVITAIGFAGAFDMDEPSDTGTATGLTSGGVDVIVTSSVDGLTLTGTAGGVVVFTLEITDVTTGAFTFTQLAAVDHPDLGETSAEDILRLNFTYTVTDLDGDAVVGTASIDIGDDAPVVGTSESATVEDEGLIGGNDEADGFAKSVSGVSLNIDWGADNANAGGSNDRSVAFTDAAVAVEGAYGAELTSGGNAVHTVVLADGTLVGYTGAEVPAAIDGAGVVFHAELSDANDGEYSFTLVKPLDHAEGDGENALSLTFNFTASDSDGDTATGSFVVNVVDDVPLIDASAIESGVVEEEQRAVAGPGNEDRGGLGDDDRLFNYDVTTNKTGGTLAIAWGADNGDNESLTG
ncbi:DUF5801 repeats-in-toxin domain-containing protein, partial [Agrobacterium sp. ES01]|uniref:T1SS-143 repeat domain-containing protein n=1 Tax=Agrobacterium sp. ES01 TaxID=3420714 RepID=UPI003D1055C5